MHLVIYTKLLPGQCMYLCAHISWSAHLIDIKMKPSNIDHGAGSTLLSQYSVHVSSMCINVYH